jgi:hypothetical protein
MVVQAGIMTRVLLITQTRNGKMKVLTASQLCTICRFAGVRDISLDGNFRWDAGGSGCDAVFVNIDGVTGLKAFHTEAVAKLSYHYNRIFSHFGYTPKAWGLSSVKVWGHEFFYFFTEVCEGYYDDESYEREDSDDDDYYEYPALFRFERKMSGITGFENVDIHPSNYGYLNRKLVCIDIGHIAYVGGNKRITPKWD